MNTPTATEAMMREIWQEVLDVDEVGLDDDFYALGGTSLLTTQLLAALRRRSDVPIRLAQLAKATTVREAAALHDAAAATQAAETEHPVRDA